MDKIKNILNNLSLPNMLGQMMMISIKGTRVTDDVRDLIQTISPGGVILFKENYQDYEQLRQLCYELQEIAKTNSSSIPLFISVDQEGGRVVRLSEPFTMLPSAKEIGVKGADYVYERASCLAKELKEVGINMDHAPVLDVDNNKDNPIIGDRSFSHDPNIVAKLGFAFFKGLQDNGIISTGKHFPGHGDTCSDSHLDLPIVLHDKLWLEKIELHPFREAIKKGIETIMTAHVLYPNLDKKYPATLSKKIVKDILRKELGFNGLIITDDLSMKGITLQYNQVEASYLALKAGASIILICKQTYDVYKNIHRTLLEKVEGASSTLIAQVKREVKNILSIKQKYLIM
ncbi:MAG: beta-N-acetylhexosaminidase [bacterium]